VFERWLGFPTGVGAGGVVGKLVEFGEHRPLASEDHPVGIDPVDVVGQQLAGRVEMVGDLFVPDPLEAAL